MEEPLAIAPLHIQNGAADIPRASLGDNLPPALSDVLRNLINEESAEQLHYELENEIEHHQRTMALFGHSRKPGKV